jgi:plasmid stabilization system protein ParE
LARLTWSLVALDHLEDIVNQIAEDSPAYAAAFSQRIFDAADRLKAFPELGRIVPKYDRRDLRNSSSRATACCTASTARMSGSS